MKALHIAIAFTLFVGATSALGQQTESTASRTIRLHDAVQFRHVTYSWHKLKSILAQISDEVEVRVQTAYNAMQRTPQMIDLIAAIDETAK